MSLTFLTTRVGTDPDPSGNPNGGGGPITDRYVYHEMQDGTFVQIPVLARINKNNSQKMEVLDWDKYKRTDDSTIVNVEYDLIQISRSTIPIGDRKGDLNPGQLVEDGVFFGAIITGYYLKEA